MGVYLNPRTEGFERAVRSEIFVDKTEMIGYLNTVVGTNQNDVSVSRPRRFGKTMATNMIAAYYGRGNESRHIFEPLKLAGNIKDWDRYLNKFDVISIVTTDFMEDSDNVDDFLGYMTDEVAAELMEAYPDISYGRRINLRTVMDRIYSHTGSQFVIIVDEWDAIFRIWKNDSDGQVKYLDFLRNLLKDKPYVALAYITGILPIKKYGEHSALNMFDEYSMIAPMQLAQYTGFTDEEVRELCDKYKMSYNEMADWYDGYIVGNSIPVNERKPGGAGGYANQKYSIYSPLSVVKALRNGIVANYWNSTESYVALADYICMDFDGLKNTVALLMAGGRVKVNISTYQNDMTTFKNRDDVLTLLIHLGYLGYDEDTGEVFIPNKEILQVFRDSTETEEWAPVFDSFRKSQELLKATWSCDEKKVAELLEWFHDQTSNKTYNDESALSYAIQMAYYAAQKYYTTVLELDSGKGYADIAYLPAPKYADKPALIIELKYNRDAMTAMNQIMNRNYPQRLEHYKGNMLLIGINYDKEVANSRDDFKHHICNIVRG